MHEVAGRVGQHGRGVRHVQWMLAESLREERDPAAALRRTRMVLDHLDQDRHLMAATLLEATAEVRRHTPVPFDADTLRWLEEVEEEMDVSVV